MRGSASPGIWRGCPCAESSCTHNQQLYEQLPFAESAAKSAAELSLKLKSQAHRSLGLTVPPSILARADEIIE